jgi:hypothetical protein
MVGFEEVLTRYGLAMIAEVVFNSASDKLSKYNTSKTVVSKEGSKPLSI